MKCLMKNTWSFLTGVDYRIDHRDCVNSSRAILATLWRLDILTLRKFDDRYFKTVPYTIKFSKADPYYEWPWQEWRARWNRIKRHNMV